MSLDNHFLEQAGHKRFFVKQQYYIEGEGKGHLLTSIARAQQGLSIILELSPILLGSLEAFTLSIVTFIDLGMPNCLRDI